MAYGNVSWATNDPISLTKMTQINDNAIDNRKRSTYEMIISNPIFEEDAWSGSLADVDVWLEIDSSRFGSIHNFSGQSIGSGNEDDVDLTSLSNGIHSISFHFESNGGGSVSDTRSFRFLKTDTNNFLTYWFTYDTSGSGMQFTNVNVLLHQVVENLAP